MNLDNIPEELFDIITKSSYEALSIADKTLIDKYLSKAEYDEIHQFLGNFSEADKHLEDSIKMEDKVEAIPLWRKISNYRMPLYKVAALYLLLAGSYFLYQHQVEPIPTQNKMNKKVSIDEEIYPADLIFEL